MMHVSRIHVFMMQGFMMIEPDTYMCMMNMCVACIYDPRSLTLLHVCMMHISMILDPDACVYDAGMNDTYIHDL